MTEKNESFGTETVNKERDMAGSFRMAPGVKPKAFPGKRVPWKLFGNHARLYGHDCYPEKVLRGRAENAPSVHDTRRGERESG